MDSATTFVQPGTLRRPKLIGRTVRMLLGLACCYGALQYAVVPGVFLHQGSPPLFAFLWPAVALWLLPPVVNLGFGRSWKDRPSIVTLLACAGAILVDFAVYGQMWGPPLGVVVYTVTVYTFAHLGSSFILASVLATPGCEMRDIPDLLGRLSGNAAQEHHCPGFIQPLDDWEARRQQSARL